jgi:hypothetical protein
MPGRQFGIDAIENAHIFDQVAFRLHDHGQAKQKGC